MSSGRWGLARVARVVLKRLVVAAVLSGCSWVPLEASEVQPGSQQAGHGEAAAGRKDACESASVPDLRDLWGRYTVVSVQRYRGGLTPKPVALERIGRAVILSEDEFVYDGSALSAPRYRLVCQDDIVVEGEVPGPAGRSVTSFYGFRSEREVIWILKVRGEGDGRSIFAFEIAGARDGLELWEPYDGFIYLMEKAGGPGGYDPR